MALAKRQSSSTRIAIIGVVIVVVAGIGYILYQQFFLNPNDGAVDATTQATKSVITNFNESILQDPRYTSLKSFDASVQADANVDGGQAEPFQ